MEVGEVPKGIRWSAKAEGPPKVRIGGVSGRGRGLTPSTSWMGGTWQAKAWVGPMKGGGCLNSHVLICFSMDKWAICGHFYLYVDPVWSLYNIKTGCHVFAQVAFWVDLHIQRRLCLIFV